MKRMIKLSVVIVIAMMSITSMALLFTERPDGMYYQQGNKVTPPRNLQARGYNGYIELEWEAPAQGSGDVAAYMIYRSLSSDYQSYYLQVDDENFTYSDYNVDNGRTYYYWVRALTEDSDMTDFSNRAEATPYGTSPPTPPQNLKAYPGDSRIMLDWDKPEDEGGSSIVNYKVYRSTSPGEETQAYTIGTGTQFTDYDVTNGQTYYYLVSALNSVGESTHSNEAYATPSSDISEPSSPRNLEAFAGNGFVELHWDEPLDDGGSAIQYYIVYRDSDYTLNREYETDGDLTFYYDDRVQNGDEYFYKVSAVNAQGEGLISSEVKVRPTSANIPSAPKNLQATPGDSEVLLQWDEIDDDIEIDYYHIYRGKNPNNLDYHSRVLGNETDLIDTTVLNGQTYYYMVRVISGGKVGLSSNIDSATPMVGLEFDTDTGDTDEKGSSFPWWILGVLIIVILVVVVLYVYMQGQKEPKGPGTHEWQQSTEEEQPPPPPGQAQQQQEQQPPPPPPGQTQQQSVAEEDEWMIER